MWTAWRAQRLSPAFHADDTAPGSGDDDVLTGDRHCYAHPMCILPCGALGLEQDLSGHRPRSAWACVTVRLHGGPFASTADRSPPRRTVRLHGGGAREDVRRSAQPLFAGCDPGRCFRGLPVRRAFTRNSALREAATGVRGRSGQPRPYVRPAARHLPLAIMGVRLRVRRQAVWRARGTRLSSALPETARPAVLPITLFSACRRIVRARARRLPRAPARHAVAAAGAAPPFAR